ncbi:transglycosylase domain-containing protein [Peribacillus alkalitolerans]|uniref:transglycosylase domain-containing protein n=1 Tax=Peribacillus alkalitolerans TaxID=1550385 RepID=UPI001F081620|nr:PBP1A family penicillin-binding protein [Peribacillus alkalitolerans]
MDQIKILKIGVVLFSGMALAIAGFFHFFKPETNIDNLESMLQQPTVIYDQNSEVASKISANKTEGVPIEDIPEHVKNAVIAIEDHRFYEHNGVDYQGIARAFVTNLIAGDVVQGGSTITQQLTKNALLDMDRTYKRKVEEFFLAREVEKRFSKGEILEMYMNQIYFGHGAWGINNASMAYFGKNVKDITPSEAALLAGLIKAPSSLDPYKNYENAIKRRNIVLNAMKQHGLLDNAQYEEAVNQEIIMDEKKSGDPLKGKYPYYVDHVIMEAIQKYKMNQDELLTGGYKIYTTLDQNMQKAAEEVYQDDSLFPKGSTEQELVQSGSILMDPKTGGIKALVGGRGEHTFLAYNRATMLKKQPGSTMKPLAVYTPALEAGFKPNDMLKDDEKLSFGEYKPSNLSGEYAGEVPMYEALMKSINVPTVWLLNEIGIQKGMDAAKRFGIPLDAKEDRVLGLGLGGLSQGVSPKIMAEAFSAFPNNGVRIEAHAIVKIVDREGNEVVAWKEEKTKVMGKKISDGMTSMLLGVVKHGTGKNAAVNGWELAGKTGSTQHDQVEGAVKDQWFVGYTPTLVGAVWAGYDQPNKDRYLTTHSSQGAAIIFQRMMTKALVGMEPVDFNVEDIDTIIAKQKQLDEERARREFWENSKSKLQYEWKRWKESFSGKKGKEEEKSEAQEGKEEIKKEKKEEEAENKENHNTTDSDLEDKETTTTPVENEDNGTGDAGGAGSGDDSGSENDSGSEDDGEDNGSDPGANDSGTDESTP